MDKQVEYISAEDEVLIRRNPRAEKISERLHERTKAMIDNNELGEIVHDPLGALIEEARTNS